MSDRMTFSRTARGDFDLSESNLRRFTARLVERTGHNGHRVPESLMDAASRELIRVTHQMADERKIEFAAAIKRVVHERPSLLWLTRGTTVRDGSHESDVEIEE